MFPHHIGPSLHSKVGRRHGVKSSPDALYSDALEADLYSSKD
jgi:cytochrome c2